MPLGNRGAQEPPVVNSQSFLLRNGLANAVHRVRDQHLHTNIAGDVSMEASHAEFKALLQQPDDQANLLPSTAAVATRNHIRSPTYFDQALSMEQLITLQQ
jgi:hypothetical protein